ncbi:uncharacterized protein LOC100830013 [Brachypodium distachyon]|uniref:Uncharacterized protein n=1 Tax=Brachypodium distachyon TaxID=15368 RepID=I1HC28_BRADI|nr:uncharacterized protein LOC100830013 [Brachypodium distachyon]KQK02736.1 hypothetical protein BRADI_2g03370v3 [Brachypodium distachyon]|eukprot:XP_003568775.1 uncharacterized protein LOC100830013 [Brachypodium distachyon]
MPPRTSDHLEALSLQIERKLHKALTSNSQRLQLLQQLFADIALKVDDRARDAILSRSDEGIPPVDEREDSYLCFYEILANHYVRVPESGRRILELIVQLWSQSFAANIFALLFHRWLFEVPLDGREVSLRYSSALVQGATNVFWIDIQTNTRHFLPLYHYLLEEVALVPDQLSKISLQAGRNLFCLLSRFMLFYDQDHLLASFLEHFPVFPNSFLVGGPADYFVIELTDQLQKLKVEPVLLHYLSRMTILQGWELRMSTSTRLKSCLYSFTSPGGPAYPTRAVRHAAWNTLDFLFPVGRYPRHVISLFFRLLYPWYWPSSCWNFVMTCVMTVYYYILNLLLSIWDNMRRPSHQRMHRE